jgi:hypothetical protein
MNDSCLRVKQDTGILHTIVLIQTTTSGKCKLWNLMGADKQL